MKELIEKNWMLQDGDETFINVPRKDMAPKSFLHEHDIPTGYGWKTRKFTRKKIEEGMLHKPLAPEYRVTYKVTYVE